MDQSISHGFHVSGKVRWLADSGKFYPDLQDMTTYLVCMTLYELVSHLLMEIYRLKVTLEVPTV